MTPQLLRAAKADAGRDRSEAALGASQAQKCGSAAACEEMLQHPSLCAAAIFIVWTGSAMVVGAFHSFATSAMSCRLERCFGRFVLLA